MLTRKRELVALLLLSFGCLVTVNFVMWLVLAVPWVVLQFVIVVFPDHIRLLFVVHIQKKMLGVDVKTKNQYLCQHGRLNEAFAHMRYVQIYHVFAINKKDGCKTPQGVLSFLLHT